MDVPKLKEFLSVHWTAKNPATVVCLSNSEADTDEVGAQIARLLAAGDVVALVGDLGAGKTRFVKAVASALGVPADDVSSPTFTLIQEYAGRIPIRHCDTYRLRDVDEFVELGLDELFSLDGIAMVEWSDRVEDYLPLDRLVVRIEIESPTVRRFEVSATGDRSQRIITSLTWGI
jgi:tRNA threonylcarbamoyladenosine biosynthesis protein TsaE